MKVIVTILVLTAVLHAQNPATEAEWRSANAAALRELKAASANKWGGVALAGAGVGLLALGMRHRETCRSVGAASILAPGTCQSYPLGNDWRLMGPGLGAIGAGVTFAFMQTRRQNQKAERVRELEQIRTQRGWSLSLNATSMNLAYRW
jgi:hypothetical protein